MKFRVLHFFSGIGGKALGFAHATATHGDASAEFETIGGIDLDALACQDFESLTGAPALVADVHEMEPADLLAFAGEVTPDVVAMSPPCKGLSALLSAKKAAEPQYQKMNTLMLRALMLVVSTWDRPPPLIFVENVPRMTSRGKDVVRKTVAILEAHGYAITMGTHDCGELGGLAQHRPRWFLLARHRAQMPGFVYQPPKKRVRACGEVLGPLPMPGDVAAAGPMHSIPNLSWRNWLRLAAIPAGGDWRDLPSVLEPGQKKREKFRRLPVTSFDAPAETVTGPGGSASTNVADPRLALFCTPRRDAYGVLDFEDPSKVVTGAMGIDNARAAVADPRIGMVHRDGRHENKYAVHAWDHPAPVVMGAVQVGSGAPSVADPRFGHVDRVTPWSEPVGTITHSPAPSSGAAAVADPRWGAGAFGVTAWDDAAATVTGESLPSNGRNAVADPRIPDLDLDGDRRNDDLGVLEWQDPASAITGDARPRKGRFSVADPRFADGKKKNWQQVAGVTPWTSPAPTVTAGAKIHAGAFQVADPRTAPNTRYRIMTLAEALALDLPLDKAPPFIPLIIAEDGTWHRPLTTLELGVLQSLPPVIDGAPLVLAMRKGARSGHTRWRMAIGNLVPPAAALAVGNQLVRSLLLAALGAFTLDNNDIWVAPEQRAMVV